MQSKTLAMWTLGTVKWFPKMGFVKQEGTLNKPWVLPNWEIKFVHVVVSASNLAGTSSGASMLTQRIGIALVFLNVVPYVGF